ncbi:DNA polymerase III subunit delta [Bacteroidia bacterium]|nr:DNA polymerase III subunit delta [Bacteroidia bacterium]
MAKGTSSYNEFNALMQQLDNKEVAPIYLLQGEEYRMLEQLLDKIEQVVLDETTKSFNHHLFYGRETTASDIVNVARRFPMMAEKQLVVYKEAQYCRNPDEIIEYLNNPVPSTVLVWYHPGKKIASNRKVGKAFAAKGKVFNGDAVDERQVAQVVTQLIKDVGYDIEPKPLHLLIENSGGKFSVIIKELDKVFSNVEKGNKIREEHIEKYVGINKNYNVFALQKALAKKQRVLAMEILDFFTSNINNHPVPLMVGALFSYFRKVAVVQSMRKSTDKEIMSAVGIPFFAMSEYREASKNFGGKKMVKVIEALNDCDLKFKGIKENAGGHAALFEETILKILAL